MYEKNTWVLIMIIGVSLICSACIPNYGWVNVQENIARMEDLGFAVYMENNAENAQDVTKSINDQLLSEGKTFTVEIVSICNLTDENYDIISFNEFKTKEYYKDYLNSGSEQKSVRFGKIVISSNSEKAIGLLEYNFK